MEATTKVQDSRLQELGRCWKAHVALHFEEFIPKVFRSAARVNSVDACCGDFLLIAAAQAAQVLHTGHLIVQNTSLDKSHFDLL